jgi:hypothetical protein
MRRGRGKRATAGIDAGLTIGSATPATGACSAAEPALPIRIARDMARGGRGKSAAARLVVGLTVQRLTRAARATWLGQRGTPHARI